MRVIRGAVLLSCAAALTTNEDVKGKSLRTAGQSQTSSGQSPAAQSEYGDRHYYPGGGHTPQWYKEKCTAIKLSCEDQKEDVEAAHASHVGSLEDEYKKETKQLGRAEDSDESAETAAGKQKDVVESHEEYIKKKEAVAAKTAKCPGELRKLLDELEELEATPNKSEKDIEDECAKKKEILAKEKCVDEHFEARKAIEMKKAKLGCSERDLSEDEAKAQRTGEALSSQSKETDDAKDELDYARSHGPEKGIAKIESQCDRELEALRRLADKEVAKAQDDYDRHAGVLASRKKDQAEEREDVAEQKKDVAEERKEVKAAEAEYASKKTCPAELEKAQQELEALEAAPNKSEEDIDAECKKKKEILQKQKCVEEFYEAQSVLAGAKGAYAAEDKELGKQREDEQAASTAVKNYRGTLQEFKEALEASKASRTALEECVGPSSGAWRTSWVSSPLLAAMLAVGVLLGYA